MLLGFQSQSQINTLTLQAGGLTCSMCNLTIMKRLQKIDFIDSIQPNVETASYIIQLKPNVNLNVIKIKDALVDAGFSVAKLIFSPNGIVNETENSFKYQGYTYNIIDGLFVSQDTKAVYMVINQDFLSNKNYKKYKQKNKISTNNSIINLVKF